MRKRWICPIFLWGIVSLLAQVRVPGPGGASAAAPSTPTFVNLCSAQCSSPGAGCTATISSCNMSGATNLIAVEMASGNVASNQISDSINGTTGWNVWSASCQGNGGSPNICFHQNLAPSVSSSMNFSVTADYAALYVLGFTNMATSSGTNQTNGAYGGASSSPQSTGLITPGAKGKVIVSGLGVWWGGGWLPSVALTNGTCVIPTGGYLTNNEQIGGICYVIQSSIANTALWSGPWVATGVAAVIGSFNSK